MKQLNLFTKSQPSDLEILDNMVSYQNTSTVDLLDPPEFRLPFRSDPMPSSQLDWDIQKAIEAGDEQRAHELLTIKYDMGN
tara:strand:- start:10478 stop:10720 length:243 start_codon:yes stop_codon:yes gene_type:complete